MAAAVRMSGAAKGTEVMVATEAMAAMAAIAAIAATATGCSLEKS